ncbi:hypothetical protein E2C01_075155 [Portunus trituberculatus]|uniref:Uncharacterized protein n=1 Tax=Portunus trituberculatus TaxID=210409 RepID=A0A5B7IE95_PORTR|nr:hypothetical protein [Portunus trituberculatus]
MTRQLPTVGAVAATGTLDTVEALPKSNERAGTAAPRHWVTLLFVVLFLKLVFASGAE